MTEFRTHGSRSTPGSHNPEQLVKFSAIFIFESDLNAKAPAVNDHESNYLPLFQVKKFSKRAPST